MKEICSLNEELDCQLQHVGSESNVISYAMAKWGIDGPNLYCEVS